MLKSSFWPRLPCLSYFLLPNFDTSTSTHRLYAAVVPEGSDCFGVTFFLIFRGTETIHTGSSCFVTFWLSSLFHFAPLLPQFFYILYSSHCNWLYLNLFHNNTILHLHVLDYFWAKHSLDPPFCAGWGIAFVSQDSCLQFWYI